MNYRSIIRFTSAALLTLSAAQVFAGDFFEDKGVALNSYDALSYFTPSPDPILGSKELSFDYKGSKFYFITPAHLRTFASDPAKYAPQYDGFDAYGVSQGRKVGAHPRVFALVDGKLYMFSDLKNRARTGRRTSPATSLVPLSNGRKSRNWWHRTVNTSG